MPVTACDLLYDRVLPFCEALGVTQGRCGSLALHRTTLAFTTPPSLARRTRSVAMALPPRIPTIQTEPRNLGKKNYTNYRPQPHSRVRVDVRRMAGNGSFVSRCLLV